MTRLLSCAIALLWALATPGAWAMAAMDDADLAAVHGRDGVSLAVDLNIHIGAFVYSTQSASNPGGGSMAFNNIAISGLFMLTVDVLSASSFTNALSSAMSGYGSDGAAGLSRFLSSGLFDGRSDVIQLAIPNAALDQRLSPSLSVGAITMGNSSNAFGSLALTHLDMQGSKVWLWAH